jgi:prolyl-tRNA editing enzyme YbaK/EbsC (Cys-tRNA(Pro) deacylase)
MNGNPLPERSRIVEEHLAAAGIAAQIHQLPSSTRTAAEAAEALGCEVGAIASSLHFVADDEPGLVMTSGRHRVDPVQLGAALGVDDVRLASAERVRSVTGQAIGGVAPTGHPEAIRTVIDETLQQHSTIWAAAGTPHTVMALTFTDLITLTNGARVVVASN